MLETRVRFPPFAPLQLKGVIKMSLSLKEKMLKSNYCIVIAEGDNWCMIVHYDKKKIVTKYTYLTY